MEIKTKIWEYADKSLIKELAKNRSAIKILKEENEGLIDMYHKMLSNYVSLNKRLAEKNERIHQKNNKIYELQQKVEIFERFRAMVNDD